MAIHEASLNKSQKSFRESVEPIVSEWIEGEFHSNEGEEGLIPERLDQDSGVDVWVFGGGERSGTIGIASRVQWPPGAIDPSNDSPWNTFTIRYERSSGQETEYQKRKREIHRPSLKPPHYTVQAYLSEPCGEPLSIGMVETEPLIRFCEDNLEGEEEAFLAGEKRDPGYGVRHKPEPGIPGRWSRFYWVKWWHLDVYTTFGPQTWPTNKPYDDEAMGHVLNASLDDFAIGGET